MNNNWETQLLRLTLFSVNPELDFDPNEAWMSIVGEYPDEINSQPKIKRFAAESTYGLGKLILKTQPNRIDLVYAAKNPDSPEILPLIAGYEDAYKVFKNVTDKWFVSIEISQIKRLAYGGIFVKSQENHVAAYEELDELLPDVSIDSKNSSDFLYQINRPRILEIDSLNIKVNRLSKWSVGAAFEREFVLVDGLPKFTSAPAVYNIHNKLELDINTEADFDGIIPIELQLKVFQELVTLGDQIVEQGDIP